MPSATAYEGRQSPSFDHRTSADARQAALDFTTARLPLPDPRVTAEARQRLSRQALLILGRLTVGPASNGELTDIAQRFGARIHELRKAGHDIRITEHDHASGRVVYALFQEAK